MTDERYKFLESFEGLEAELTEDEIAEGWHWCHEFDGLLVGPGMPELRCCTCLPDELKSKLVAQLAPEPTIDQDNLKDSDFTGQETIP